MLQMLGAFKYLTLMLLNSNSVAISAMSLFLIFLISSVEGLLGWCGRCICRIFVFCFLDHWLWCCWRERGFWVWCDDWKVWVLGFSWLFFWRLLVVSVLCVLLSSCFRRGSWWSGCSWRFLYFAKSRLSVKGAVDKVFQGDLGLAWCGGAVQVVS